MLQVSKEGNSRVREAPLRCVDTGASTDPVRRPSSRLHALPCSAGRRAPTVPTGRPNVGLVLSTLPPGPAERLLGQHRLGEGRPGQRLLGRDLLPVLLNVLCRPSPRTGPSALRSPAVLAIFGLIKVVLLNLFLINVVLFHVDLTMISDLRRPTDPLGHHRLGERRAWSTSS
jgi:hypothetical protein